MKTKGYTLIEILVVLLMMGILVAIAAPAWRGFWQRQQIRTATERLQLALVQAKSLSRQKLIRHAVTVCSKTGDQDESILYSVHPYFRVPIQFVTLKNVSLVKSTVRPSPRRYNLSAPDADCYTSYTGVSPGDGYTLGFFYLSNRNSQYIHRVGFNTLIGNITSCPVVSLQRAECQ